jgi:hypothetical protein
MSGLANYAAAAHDLAQELILSLESAEVQQLHDQLLGTSVRDWIAWRIKHHEVICKFVSSTPSQRLKLKKFQANRLSLSLAGIQLCKEGAALLTVITAPVLQAGGSYRDTAMLAGDAYNRLYEHNIPYWPFKESQTPFTDDPEND